MPSRRLPFGVIAMLVLLSSSVMLNASSSHDAEVVIRLQTTLDNLVENKILCEEFVRDIKANVKHSDDSYSELMDSYSHARRYYDFFLDSLESSGKGKVGRSMKDVGAIDVQNATADFLADAANVLKMPGSKRHSMFQRTLIIPEDMPKAIRSLPKKAREQLIDRFDKEVRWHDWSEL